jgi:hypothetical protein
MLHANLILIKSGNWSWRKREEFRIVTCTCIDVGKSHTLLQKWSHVASHILDMLGKISITI